MCSCGKSHEQPYVEVYGGTTEDQPSWGFGDTVAKAIHAMRLDTVAAAYTEITGKPCGCSERQATLNRLFPYKR